MAKSEQGDSVSRVGLHLTPNASQAIDRLVADGCDAASLLQLIQSIRDTRHILNLESADRASINRISNACRELSERLTHFFNRTNEGRSAQLLRYASLPGTLSGLAEWLNELDPSSLEVPEVEARAALIGLVKASTGHFHDREIADLLSDDHEDAIGENAVLMWRNKRKDRIERFILHFSNSLGGPAQT